MAKNMTVPTVANQGDFIYHDLVKGYNMRVIEVRPCIPDWNRPQDHDQYLVKDPDGALDWLCAYDVTLGPC